MTGGVDVGLIVAVAIGFAVLFLLAWAKHYNSRHK